MNVTLKNTPYAKLLERKRLMQIPSEKKDKNIPRHTGKIRIHWIICNHFRFGDFYFRSLV